MKCEDSDVIELIKAVYEQHWLHARHVENERLWFANIFTAILVGTISVIRKQLFDPASIPLIVLLMALSVIGMLMSIKFDSIYKTHKRAAEQILEICGLPHLNAQFREHWVNSQIRVSRLFPYIYALITSYLIGVLAHIWSRNLFISVATSITVAVVALVWLYKLGYDRYDDIEDQGEFFDDLLDE